MSQEPRSKSDETILHQEWIPSRLARRGSSLRIIDRPNTWRRSIYGTLAAVCSFYALASSRIALGDAATLGATTPIFVVLLSGPLLAERVDGRILLALGRETVPAGIRPPS